MRSSTGATCAVRWTWCGRRSDSTRTCPSPGRRPYVRARVEVGEDALVRPPLLREAVRAPLRHAEPVTVAGPVEREVGAAGRRAESGGGGRREARSGPRRPPWCPDPPHARPTGGQCGAQATATMLRATARRMAGRNPRSVRTLHIVPAAPRGLTPSRAQASSAALPAGTRAPVEDHPSGTTAPRPAPNPRAAPAPAPRPRRPRTDRSTFAPAPTRRRAAARSHRPRPRRRPTRRRPRRPSGPGARAGRPSRPSATHGAG